MPKPKIIINAKYEKPAYRRESLRTYLLNKYFNLYMNNYEFEGDIDYQQKEYILKRLWADGQIACFKLKGTEGTAAHPQGLLVFCPFAAGYWNIYDYPVKVNLINTRGVRFIPAGLQEVDKDVVIGYAQRNRKSIFSVVDLYVKRMVNVLMVIDTNLKAHKMPWLIAGTEEEKNKLQFLAKALENDEPELFAEMEDVDKLKALVSGAPYIIDKLYNYYGALENELREYLGFQNVGISEKKEHLIGEEVRANNDLIEANKECLLNVVQEFFDRVREVFNIEITIKVRKNESSEYDEEGDEEEMEVEENV